MQVAIFENRAKWAMETSFGAEIFESKSLKNCLKLINYVDPSYRFGTVCSTQFQMHAIEFYSDYIRWKTPIRSQRVSSSQICYFLKYNSFTTTLK